MHRSGRCAGRDGGEGWRDGGEGWRDEEVVHGEGAAGRLCPGVEWRGWGAGVGVVLAPHSGAALHDDPAPRGQVSRSVGMLGGRRGAARGRSGLKNEYIYTYIYVTPAHKHMRVCVCVYIYVYTHTHI